MKWALQHVKVTLQESDTGETLVIEQRPDGKVSCKTEKSTDEGGDKRKKAAETEAPKKGAAKAEKGAKADKPADKPTRADKSEAKPAKTNKSEPKPAKSPKAPDEPVAAKADKPRARRKKSLEWYPIKKITHEGFAAKSGGGLLKALHARNTQWALFYEHPHADARHLGCFPDFEEAREAAQALHDRGIPEPQGITEEKVILLCPMPEASPTKPEEAPTEPANTDPAKDTATLTPEMRAEMMASMKDAIRTAMEGAA